MECKIHYKQTLYIVYASLKELKKNVLPDVGQHLYTDIAPHHQMQAMITAVIACNTLRCHSVLLNLIRWEPFKMFSVKMLRTYFPGLTSFYISRVARQNKTAKCATYGHKF